MRRRSVFVTLVTGVLALGLLGGTVAAQESDAAGGGRTGFLARVAEILGIGEQELTDVFDQAKTEIRDEREDEFIDKAIEKGDLTDEEIAELRERFENGELKPLGRGFHFGRGFGRHRDGTTFTFRFRGDLGDLPELDGAFPNIDGLQERIERFRERLQEEGRLRHFEGPGFRFYFGPPSDGDADKTDDEPVADGVSL